ncbi:MAG TPA: stage III sporulation protein AF [Candidatus Egerieimonas intestinavium]|uniref:Stage III sporulation protein AF n=1 Tax=Candidatus Egerieimonas intestinavium TaxID=2840777 RepID=A0A9D1EJG8_9FIRM|nr:stage III sporulation protein AF [Candidatus Egerieimonas intestinavium]
MTEAIYGWMRNLAYTLLFFTAVLQLLPEGDYRRYVKYFLGLLLILTVMGPLLDLFSLEDSLGGIMDRYLERSEDYQQEAFSEGERIADSYVKEAAALTVEGQLLEIFSGEELAVADLSMEQGEDGLPTELWVLAVPREAEGQIVAGNARTAPESQQPRAQRLKNQVGEVYGLSAEHIHISIRE